jgi:hypothetical protein
MNLPLFEDMVQFYTMGIVADKAFHASKCKNEIPLCLWKNVQDLESLLASVLSIL